MWKQRSDGMNLPEMVEKDYKKGDFWAVLNHEYKFSGRAR